MVVLRIQRAVHYILVLRIQRGLYFFFAFGESLVLMVVTMAKLDIFSHNFG